MGLPYNKYHLLPKFEGNTVSYGPIFFAFSSFKLKWKKQGAVTFSTNQENQVSKMSVTDISWKLNEAGKHTTKSSSPYFRIQTTCAKSTNHSPRSTPEI